MVEKDRLQFLEVTIVIGQIDRNAILQQRQAAHMEPARKARSADRDADLLPEARLRVDTGRKGERIAQGNYGLVGIIFMADNVCAARSLGGPLFCFVRRSAAGHNDRGIGSLFGGNILGKRNGKSACRSGTQKAFDIHGFFLNLNGRKAAKQP